MHSLELRIPPLVVFGLFAGLMWYGSRAVPAADFPLPARHLFAFGLTAIGISTAVAGVVSFRLARTTVNPLKPESASALVTHGIYQRTRNPMYLGALFVLIAWAVFLANALTFIGVAAFVLYLTRFQIIPEERALATRFGPDFAAYCAKVRRWI